VLQIRQQRPRVSGRRPLGRSACGGTVGGLGEIPRGCAWALAASRLRSGGWTARRNARPPCRSLLMRRCSGGTRQEAPPPSVRFSRVW